MLGLESVIALLSKNGLVLVAPIAVIEGPIVTVIAAWLASRGLIDLFSLIVVVILADLFGDSLLYALGRWGMGRLPDKWRRKMGLRRARLRELSRHFGKKGGRTLAFGKLTHSVGAAILVAAGLARMPFGQFLFFNLLATIPKSLAFVALGYTLGSAYARIDDWIGRASLVAVGLISVAVLVWLHRRWATR